jgi:Beta-propeller repeat
VDPRDIQVLTGANNVADRTVSSAHRWISTPATFAVFVFAAVICFPRAGGTQTSTRARTDASSASARHAIPNNDARTRAMDFYREIPMSFEANDGQEDLRVKYSSRAQGYRVFLTKDGATLAFRADRQSPVSSVTMKLRGANCNPRVTGIEKLPGITNYFLGQDPSRWKRNVANYSKIEYQSVYPGVDLLYYGKDEELEYDFIVHPAARPSDIKISFSSVGGTQTAQIDSNGELTLRARDREVHLHRPTAYQLGPHGEHSLVGAHYLLSNQPVHSIKKYQELTIVVGDYDRLKPLIIDPVVTFSTYLGGESFDTATAVTLDTTGNIYLVGWTQSPNFPTLAPLQPTLHGVDGDAFVTKINAAGSAILYSTFLGGILAQAANGVAVDMAGNAYVAGSTTSADFPVTPGAFDTTSSTGGAFISKLDTTGSQLIYSTYLGGAAALAVAVDGSGSAYVTGQSFSPGFPTTPGAFQQSASSDQVQAFVTKFNASGSALDYSTYLGTGGGIGIAVNALGNAYVAGDALEATFPTTPGAFQTTFGGPGGNAGDAFITELNGSGSALVYSTFLGGTSDDYATGVAVDAAGNAYVTGQTFSTNFPLQNAFQQTLKGQANGFVTKLNAMGSALLYSTYLGGSVGDFGSAIAVDPLGNTYVTGLTQSTDFPLVAALQGTFGGGSTDAFLTVLDSNGVPSFSTFIGGQNDDQGLGIAVDSSGNAYLTGSTQSFDFPAFRALQPALATAGGFVCQPGPCADAFLTKFSLSTATPPFDFALTLSPATASIAPGQPEAFTVTLTPSGGFNQTVSLGCSVQPSGPTCSLPSSLASNGLTSPAATVELGTIAATPSSSLNTERDNWTNLRTGWRFTLLLGLYGLLLVVFLAATRVHPRSLASRIGVFAILLSVVLLPTCGGGSGGTGGGGTSGGGGSAGTQPGTYTVTVTGTSAGLSHAATFTLIVN